MGPVEVFIGLKGLVTKEQELEADACAGIWMQRAKVDACAAWRGFVKIAPKDGAYAETHPTTGEREDNYRRLNGSACTTEAGKGGTESGKGPSETGRQGATGPARSGTTAKPAPAGTAASAPRAPPKTTAPPKHAPPAASAGSSPQP